MSKQKLNNNEKKAYLKITLPVIGAILSIALIVNAFYLKDMSINLVQTRIDIQTILNRSSYVDKDLVDLKNRLRRVEQKQYKIIGTLRDSKPVRWNMN